MLDKRKRPGWLARKLKAWRHALADRLLRRVEQSPRSKWRRGKELLKRFEREATDDPRRAAIDTLRATRESFRFVEAAVDALRMKLLIDRAKQDPIINFALGPWDRFPGVVSPRLITHGDDHDQQDPQAGAQAADQTAAFESEEITPELDESNPPSSSAGG